MGKPQQIRHIVAAVLRRGDEVLLVCQQAPDDAAPPGSQSVAFIFAVDEWAGEVACADPDEFVSEAQFVPLAEAIARLSQLPAAMSEPTVAYLRGEAEAGAVWCYRRHADGLDRLVMKLAAKVGDND